MSPKHSKQKDAQTTLKIDRELHASFQRELRSRNQSMKEVLVDAIRRYLDREPETEQRPEGAKPDLSQIASLMAEEVADLLRQDANWPRAMMRIAKLGLLGDRGDTFNERMGHFRSEKMHLARMFLPWLLKRVQQIVSDGKSVTLVIDSGTTLFHFLELFPNALLRHIAGNPTVADLWAEQVRLVTNNLSGLGAFITECALHPLKTGVLISDRVHCHSLPGETLAVYEAVTGEDTERALQSFRERAPSDVFIGLVTGNWISLAIDKTPAPLARGRGHCPFKKTLIDVCDENYVISPLGKIVIENDLQPGTDVVGQLNSILGYAGEKRYVDVRANELGQLTTKTLKLVSTLRIDRTQVLYPHSFLLKTLLDCIPTNDYERFVKANFNKLPHFLYPLDHQRSRKDQLDIEFPHHNTRIPAFEKLFSVTVS